jgi:hypothetical protein
MAHVLRAVDHPAGPEDPARSGQTLSPSSLFRHRTAARRHQVLTEIKTTSNNSEPMGMHQSSS